MTTIYSVYRTPEIGIIQVSEKLFRTREAAHAYRKGWIEEDKKEYPENWEDQDLSYMFMVVEKILVDDEPEEEEYKVTAADVSALRKRVRFTSLDNRYIKRALEMFKGDKLEAETFLNSNPAPWEWIEGLDYNK